MSLPLVLLHGSFGCGDDWQPVVATLGREVVTPDLPGHGARFEQPAESFAQTVAEIVDLLPERCDLCGYSLGGRLALAASIAAPPGRVRSLILESAHPGLEGAARAARLSWDQECSERLARDPATFLQTFYAAALFESFRARPEFGSILAARITRAQRAPAQLATTFAALSLGNQPPMTEALLAGQTPSLFVAGALDTKYAEIGIDLARRAAPARDLRVATVAGAGHNTHLEETGGFAAAAAAFWEDLS